MLHQPFILDHAPRPAFLTKIDEAVSTSNVLTIPASVLPGDLLVFYQYTSGTSIVTTAITPTGFISMAADQNDVSGSATVAVGFSYRIAQAGDASASVNGLNDSTDRKVLVVFRAEVPITGVLVTAGSFLHATANPNSFTITGNSLKPTPQVVVGAFGSSGAISPRTWSVGPDGEATPATNVYLGWKIQNVDVANGNVQIDMDDEGSWNYLGLAAISVF